MPCFAAGSIISCAKVIRVFLVTILSSKGRCNQRRILPNLFLELHLGRLETRRASTGKPWPVPVPVPVPCRDEEGEFFAIDLGGTNLRVAYVKLGVEKGSTVRWAGCLSSCCWGPKKQNRLWG